LRAGTPYWLMVWVLLASGRFRSLRSSTSNAFAYAEFGQARMCQASSVAAVAQQVWLALGVTIGGYALSVAGRATGGGDGDPLAFLFAFLTVGVISAISVFEMRKLAPDAGAEMAGRAEADRKSVV